MCQKSFFVSKSYKGTLKTLFFIEASNVTFFSKSNTYCFLIRGRAFIRAGTFIRNNTVVTCIFYVQISYGDSTLRSTQNFPALFSIACTTSLFFKLLLALLWAIQITS